MTAKRIVASATINLVIAVASKNKVSARASFDQIVAAKRANDIIIFQCARKNLVIGINAITVNINIGRVNGIARVRAINIAVRPCIGTFKHKVINRAGAT